MPKIAQVNANVVLVDKDGKATPEFLRLVNQITGQLNLLGPLTPQAPGVDFIGDLSGLTTTVTGGVITSVV